MAKTSNKREEVAVAPVTPQAMTVQAEYDPRGKEEVLSDKDRMYPMLTLIQKMSPSEHLEAGKEGDLINSLTLENYGKTLTIVPILTRKQRIMWIPRKQGGGIECRSFDGKTGNKWGACDVCEHGKWHQDAKDPQERKPKCTEYFTFPTLILRDGKDPELVIASFGMTRYTTGKKLANLIYGKPVAAFAGKYTLSSYIEHGELGDYANLDVAGAGLLSKEDPIYAFAENWYTLLSKDQLHTDPAV